MKYRICENGKAKFNCQEFKIQKRGWVLFVPYWEDVKRMVRKSYRTPGSDHMNNYTVTEVLFNSYIEAKNHLIWITNKYKKKEKKEAENNNWNCIGTYGKNVKWEE